MDLHGRSLLKELDFTREEFLYLVDLASQVRADKQRGASHQRLAGRNIALIFERASTRTRSAFEVAARHWRDRGHRPARRCRRAARRHRRHARVAMRST
jgi:ornithine carbamoyltransferase